jgi:protein-disulfide isomerase
VTRLQILHVPDCPGAEALDGVLGLLLAARPDVEVTRQVVTTEDEAGRLGMTGSPTILAEGRDLFPSAGQQPSLSCRLYPGEHGQLGPAPTASQLREALTPAAPR